MYPQPRSRHLGGCQTIMLGLIFIVLCGGFLFYFSSSYLNTLHFSEARCIILAKSIITSRSNNGKLDYAPEFTLNVQPSNGMAAYQTKSNYNLEQGSTSNYSQIVGIVNKFAIGQHYQCWYNPQNPFETILDRSPNLLLIGILALFVFLGIVVFFSGIVRLLRFGIGSRV